MVLVSVVILNWNRVDALKDCLKSICQQTRTADEIIVLDNNSTDGSYEMVREKFPHVRIIRFWHDLGASGECDVGFASAIGDLIVCMDNDATLEQNYIETAVKYMEENVDCGALVAHLMFRDTNKLHLPIEAYPYDTKKDILHVHCAAAVFRKSVIEAFKGFDPDYFIYVNEHQIGSEINLAGYKVTYLPELKARHWVTEKERKRTKIMINSVRNYYWWMWTYLPFKYAVKQTVFHTARFVLYSKLEDIPTLIRAYWYTLITIRGKLKKRNPVTDEKLIWPWMQRNKFPADFYEKSVYEGPFNKDAKKRIDAFIEEG